MMMQAESWQECVCMRCMPMAHDAPGSYLHAAGTISPQPSLRAAAAPLQATCTVWARGDCGMMRWLPTLPSMEPLMKYLSSMGWKSSDVTKSVCLQISSSTATHSWLFLHS